MVDVSIVIPLYNEEESVRPLWTAIREAMERVGRGYELLLVDDGSEDATLEEARQIACSEPPVKVIALRRNFGQTAALYAGFERARGEVIVTLDGDLQNDPADIGRLLDTLEEGYDAVVGWRADRKDEFLSRTLPSRTANWFIRKVTDASIKDNGCALRAYRAEVIRKFPLYSEMHRLLPTILEMAGVRVAQIPVRHHPRRFGQSKYGWGRVYKVVVDLVALKTVLTAVRKPMFGFGVPSLVGALVGLVFLVRAVGMVAGSGETSAVVYLGASMLWATLSLALVMFGVLCTYVYAQGRIRVEDLLEVREL